MPKKIFISYSHAQQEWVKTRLVPVLDAGGSEVLIDYREFGAGISLVGQMDAIQDRVNQNLLVISPDYLESANCIHEMERAISRDPDFTKKPPRTIPLIRERVDGHPNCPDWLMNNLPLWLNLSDDRAPAPWERLLSACDANLGVSAPDWLNACDEICRYLRRKESVNLVVKGKHIRWRELLEHIQKEYFPDLGMVDLQSGATVSRRGLAEEILKQCGVPENVPPEPEDLVVLDRQLSSKSFSRLILKHFDMVKNRKQYEVDLFASLRYLIMDSRKLSLLIQSHAPFLSLLPPNHPLSSITDLKTVELQAKP